VTTKGPRGFESLNDEPCSLGSVVGDTCFCLVHNQKLSDCAEQRRLQVKASREMEARTMASARTWQDQANKTREELNRLKEAKS
jgi:hypothetical protein